MTLSLSEQIRILRAARELVAQGWCQHECIGPGSYCIVGALHEASRTPGIAGLSRAMAVARRPLSEIVRWNDAAGRTQAEVLAAFDESIWLREQELQEAQS